MTLNNITAIIPCPDRKGMADIYADGELTLTVSDDTVIEAGLYVGMPLDDAALREIDMAVLLVKAKKKAYNYLSYGDMSAKKLYDKLMHAGFDEDVSRACVKSMSEYGYIDDKRYAAMLANRLANVNLYGPRRIVNELCVKGIERELAYAAANSIEADFEQNILNLANGKFRRERQKQIQALMRYGYDYDMILSVIKDDYE